MQNRRNEPIDLENLLIDLHNPRYDPRTSQRQAIITIAQQQGVKLFNLAEDIVENGLNPSELPIVTPTDDDFFTVVEGNRRVAALKILSSPSLLMSLGLSPSLSKRFKALQERAREFIPKKLECAILTREDASYWIQLKHTGENEGVGTVGWDAQAKRRFLGSSPALQAIELVGQNTYLDDETKKKLPKLNITNIERLIENPEVRKIIGIDIQKDRLILKSKDEEALGRLAMIVSDVANRIIKVSKVYTKEQQVEYAKEVASRPLPQAGTQMGTSNTSATASGTSTVQSSRLGRPINPGRNTLIPKQFKITILQTRINRIYHELQKLSVEQFVNSCAVMLRVFLELSIDEFAKKKGIKLKVPVRAKTVVGKMKDMTLREKIRAIADYLEKNGHSTKDELLGIRSLSNNREHFLSVNSLHAYVHNKDYNPTPSDLKTSWDNMEIFIKHLWTV